MRLFEIKNDTRTILKSLKDLDRFIMEQPVSSSWITDLTYDEDAGSVIMTTMSGLSYEIPDVPYEEYEDWINAPSKGKHWWSAIKGIFT